MFIHAAIASLRVHLRNTLARPLFQVILFAQPIAMALLTYYVYRRPSGGPSFYVVLGSGMSGMWVATAFSSANDLSRERMYGTIQPVLLADIPLWVVSAGRAFGALLLSVIPIVVSIVFSTCIFGISVLNNIFVPDVIFSIAAFGIACHSLGLALSNFFLLSRRTSVLQNFLEWPVLIVSGVVFPTATLPRGLQWLSAMLPMRWAAESAARSFSTAAISWDLLALAIGLSAVYFTSAVALLGTIERRVRSTGSLELV